MNRKNKWISYPEMKMGGGGCVSLWPIMTPEEKMGECPG